MKPYQTIQSVELSTIAHATDDLDKIQTALANLLPGSLKGRQLFTRRYMLGHYGNPICTFEANIRDPTDVDEFKVFLLKRLPEVERLSIVSELDKHSDSDGNLYIRIDKQKMYQGKARSGHDDPIRVRMKFSRFAGKASTLMTEYLESG